MTSIVIPTEVLEFGELRITVREWTLAEIRAHLAAPPRVPDDAVDGLLIEGWSLRDVALFTDATVADLEPLPPSEIRRLFGAIERLNVDFFGMCEKSKALALALIPPAPTWSEPSPA